MSFIGFFLLLCSLFVVSVVEVSPVSGLCGVIMTSCVATNNNNMYKSTHLIIHNMPPNTHPPKHVTERKGQRSGLQEFSSLSLS